MTNKTIRQWLKQLEEPYREQAIKNTIKYNETEVIDNPCKSFREAIMGAFVWAKTREGHDHWADLYNSVPSEEGEVEVETAN